MEICQVANSTGETGTEMLSPLFLNVEEVVLVVVVPLLIRVLILF
ncbi:hypothetical protein OROGR_018603 [Orobanche gracilis]